MEGEVARDELDGWLIGHLRQQPRRARGEAVVERLLRPHETQDVLQRVDVLEEALVGLDARVEALESERRGSIASTLRPEPGISQPRSGDECELDHTLFVPAPGGYELVEATGAPPLPGASVTIDDRRYTVEGARRTPLPFDRRPCIVLAREPVADESDSGAA
jgi:hypothetical protein